MGNERNNEAETTPLTDEDCDQDEEWEDAAPRECLVGGETGSFPVPLRSVFAHLGHGEFDDATEVAYFFLAGFAG